jgi:hypothetical protein
MEKTAFSATASVKRRKVLHSPVPDSGPNLQPLVDIVLLLTVATLKIS